MPLGTEFIKLNNGWNAEPKAPLPTFALEGTQLVLTFLPNPWEYRDVRQGDRGELVFSGCWRYRLGETNDEGCYAKQCRFSTVAPEWGMFYEARGDLRLEDAPGEWVHLKENEELGTTHFLFYFRDETFECDAERWSFRVLPG